MVLLAIGAVPPSASVPVGDCRTIELPVALMAGTPAEHRVVGELCARDASARRPIQLLLSGATEGGPAYWDFPGPDLLRTDPQEMAKLREQYSYAHYAMERGFATLSLDRIGTGMSSHPPADGVTIETNAFVVHQVVEALRSGVFGTSYETVIGVGRSLAGPILYENVVFYDDLDGLIVQSFRHHQRPDFALFPTTLQPASLEPRLADAPPGYLTTRPGTRGDMFFHGANADARVIAIEERTKETITTGEVRTFPPAWQHSDQVDVPVLAVVGAFDRLFCTPPDCPEATEEAAAYDAAPCFESVVVRDAGHNMNLQFNGPTHVFPLLLGWVEAFSQRPCALHPQ